MNPKAKRILLWALLVSLILVCGITVAYLYRATNDVTNELVPGVVECKVHEQTDTGTTTANSKTSIKVENTGNLEAWLRVRLVSYWVNADGQIVAKASEMPTFTPAADWYSAGNDTYIYTKPVAPGGSTGDLLGSGSSITLQTSTEGYQQVVEVFADAIQSEPADAVKDAWRWPTS